VFINEQLVGYVGGIGSHNSNSYMVKKDDLVQITNSGSNLSNPVILNHFIFTPFKGVDFIATVGGSSTGPSYNFFPDFSRKTVLAETWRQRKG
jgi:hypothetical protein